MNIPSIVRTFLRNSGASFKGRQVIPAESFEATVAAAGISLDKVVRPVMLKSDTLFLMAVIRADQELDLEAVNGVFNCAFTLCDVEEEVALFPECEPQALPPLAAPYALRAIIDSGIADMPQLFFASGVADILVACSGETFARLHVGSWRNHVITLGARCEAIAPTDTTRESMRSQVQSLEELPAMPGLAAEIIRLRNNPYANASELAAVIEQDPSLAAQVLRYVSSPLFAYEGTIDSVEQAIVRVLGMDFVQDLAFGLSLGKAFNNPKEGPLGLNAFWQHALYSAALTQALCNAIDFTRRPPAGVGYLAGLLHNFGILLLGHLFPEQFERLNRAVSANPGRSLLELERETIAASHTELGLWLMDAWEMPQEIREAVSEHHNPAHRGDYAIYSNMVYIANALLKRYGLGEAVDATLPQALLEEYGLDEEKVELALLSVLEGREEIEFMAAKMAA